MAIDWKKLESDNGLARAGNTAKGDPKGLTIVGVDESFDEIAARIADDDDHDRKLAILRYGCRDEDRLKEPLPETWVDGFDRTGKTDPIHFWQLVDRKGRSLAIATDGRSRILAIRTVNARRKAEGRPLITVQAIPDPYLSKNAPEIALRLKRSRNAHIPDPLSTLAEAAGEWTDLGRDVKGVAQEMAITEERAKELVKWSGLFPQMCEEARRLANAGKMPIGRAIRLVNKYPSKQDQIDYLSGKPRQKKRLGEGKPLSPRTVAIFREKIGEDSNVPLGFVALLRLLSGDTSAVEKLPPPVKAAWLRTKEAAKSRPRRTAS